MYKVASDRRQSSLHRGRLSDWVNGEELLGAEERLKQMQEGVRILESRILALPKGDAQRSALGQQKLALQGELGEFRKAVHLVRQVKRGWSETFVTMAKEMLPKMQYELIKGATDRQWTRMQRELEETPAPQSHSAGHGQNDNR